MSVQGGVDKSLSAFAGVEQGWLCLDRFCPPVWPPARLYPDQKRVGLIQLATLPKIRAGERVRHTNPPDSTTAYLATVGAQLDVSRRGEEGPAEAPRQVEAEARSTYY